MSQTNTRFTNTRTIGSLKAEVAISQGMPVGITATGGIGIADTDTPVTPRGIAAIDAAIGEVVSVYIPGDEGKILVKAAATVGQELTCGVAADAGQAIVATAAGRHRILAQVNKAASAGALAECTITYFEETIPV